MKVAKLKISVLLVIGLLATASQAGYYIALPAADSTDPQCGSWTKTSYFWDTQNSGTLNGVTGKSPLGDYGTDIRMYFCAGYVDTLPPGKYCYLQNSRNTTCATGFSVGTRKQDEEDDSNQSRREGNAQDGPRIENVGSTAPTWYYCCSDSTASYTNQFWAKQRSQLPPQFVLMRKGGTCQPLLDRTVEVGTVKWDDENYANINSNSGNVPDGTFDGDTLFQYCTYSLSTGPYEATSIDILNRTQSSISISWSGAKNAEFYNVIVKSGSSTIQNTTVTQASITINSLSTLTTYTFQIFSGKTMSSQNTYEVVGITQQIATCSSGYFGPSCSLTTCSPSCMNGKCTSPNVCTCDQGYGGTTCNTCDTGYYPSNGKCVSCPNCGNNGVCNDGPSGTGECSCFTGYKTPVSTSNYCSVCDDSYFLTNGKCEPCNSICLTCNQTDFCFSCQQGYILQTGKCTSNCTGSTYLNNNTCSPCDSSCSSCKGGLNTDCLGCSNPSFYLDGNTCVAKCPSTKFPDSNKVCRECTYPCQTCSGLTSLSCLTCKSGYILNGTISSCISESECSGYGGYSNTTNCLQCDSSCSTCSGSGSSNCLSCNSGKVLFDGECISGCPPGYVLNPSTNLCQSCTLPCNTCSSLSQNDCLSCQEPRKLYLNQCLDSCPINFYHNTTVNQCLQCSSDCLTCENSADNCLTCQNSDYLNFLGKCVSSCPNGYFPSSTKCKACIDECETCDGLYRENAVPGSFCLNCKNETLILFDGRCSSECPFGYEFKNGTCAAIPTTPTESPTETPTIAPTESPTTPNEETKKGNGVGIGVGVGLTLAFLILLAIFAFFYLKKRKTKKFEPNESQIHMSDIEEAKPGFIARKVSISIPGTSRDEDQATLMNTQLNVALPGFLLLDFYKQLREESELGSGGVGMLYHGILLDQTLINKYETDQVVIKHLKPITSLSEENNHTLFNNEVSISWALCYHPNIFKLIGYCEEPRCIVMKLYEKDLLGFLRNQNEKISVKRKLHLASDICKGINAIHKFNAAHRDIKSKNILIERGVTEDDTDIRAVICDFGLAMVYQDQMVDRKAVNLNGLSPKYAAPEIFSDARMPQPSLSVEDYMKADVYAFGVILWELVTRETPWSGSTVEQIELAVRSGERLPIPEKLSDLPLSIMIEIARKCWNSEPSHRPTMAMIVSQFDLLN